MPSRSKSTSRRLRAGLLALTVVGAWLPTSTALAAKSAAEIRADIERRRKEFEERRKELLAKSKGLDAPLAPPTSSSAANKPGGTPSGRSAVERAAASGASGAERLVSSRLRYRWRRGDQFAWHVELRTPPGDGESVWVGDIYCVVIYGSDQGPGEVMLIGRLACGERTASGWSARPQQDITFAEPLRIGPYGVYDAEVASFVNPERRLPLQMNTILPTEDLLFPGLPVFQSPTGDESRGRQTCFLSGSGQIDSDTADVYRLTKSEREDSPQPTIINQESLTFADRKIGIAYQRTGTFDVADGMPVDIDLDYLERFGGEFRIRMTMRRQRGSELARIKEQALALHPVAAWPASVKRVPVAKEAYSLAFPKKTADLRLNQSIAASLPISTGSIQASRVYRGTVAQILTDEKALIRFDGSGEERPVDYRSLHHFKP